MSELLKGNVYDHIVKRCKKNGITVTKLCDLSGVKLHKVKYWVSGNPTTVETLVKLEETFKTLEDEQVD